MTTISVEIPKLAVGQTVEAWKSLFEAATGSLKPEQRIALLPNYIDRTPGDHEVAKLGAQEDTLQAAFVVIETLIDGERTKYKSVNEFCDMKPKDDLQFLYFIEEDTEQGHYQVTAMYKPNKTYNYILLDTNTTKQFRD